MSEKVLITGGNKGIGLETTKLFYNAGYDVYIVARDFKDFEYNGDKIHKIEFDVSNTEKIEDLILDIGNIDILINNAGIMNSIKYDEYSNEKKDKLMTVNLYAPVEFIIHASKKMIEKKKGRIVNVASVAGYTGHPDIWYGISKAGIINVTKSFAKILAPYNIVVNAVAPGPAETDMLNVIPEKRKEFMKNSTYTNRFAKAGEVADTIYWLAAESPEYINGTCIDINNGSMPR